MSHSRRRRRRRSASSPGAAAALNASASEPASVAPPAPLPASPPPPRGSGPVPIQNTSSPAAGEQVWERTHLEQTMFALARDHAEAAARDARSTPANREGEQTHSLVSILMSFLALEAFINMVGGDRLGSRYRHYDRMSPEGKWMEVTRLVSKSGKTFEEEGEELRSLSTLRSWRNLLTHYKGEYEEVQGTNRGRETKVEALLSAENAARAVEIARNLYRAFYGMDRRSPPRQFIWLDDRPHRPPPGAAVPTAGEARAERVRTPAPAPAAVPAKAAGPRRRPRR